MSVLNCGGLRPPFYLASAPANQKILRETLGDQIAEQWDRIIFGDTPFDSAHRMIPAKEILESALEAQSVFERAKLNLKVRGCYKGLWVKARSERSMLDRLIVKGVDLSEQERTLQSEITRKAHYYNRAFEEQVKKSAKVRAALVEELEQRMIQFPEVKGEMSPVQEILEQSGRVKRSPVMKDEELHPSNEDYYVYTLGRPIRDRKNAKFIIIKNDQKVPQEKISHQIRVLQENGLDREVIQNGPNRALRFGVEGERAVQLSYENIEETANTHRNRGPDEKTRRRVVNDMRLHLENQKINRFCWENLGDGWSKDVKAMGIDGKEAIAVIHHMILDMLGGQISQFSEEDCRYWTEYFNAVSMNKMPERSYQDDPRFRQALDLHQMMYAAQRNYFELKPDVVKLENAVSAKYSWGTDQRKMQCLTEDFFLVWSIWQENFNALIKELKKPDYKAVCEQIGEGALRHLVGLSSALKRLVDNTPEEIRDGLEQRWQIDAKYHQIWSEMDRKKAPQSEKNESGISRVNEIEQMWKGWHQNKLPEEVDGIFSKALESIQEELKLIRPHLVGLVPFSSNKTQEKIKKILGEPLHSLYNSAIPQILSLPGKVKMTLDALEEGVETSLLTLELAETRARQVQLMNAIEFERSLDANVARDNDADRSIIQQKV